MKSPPHRCALALACAALLAGPARADSEEATGAADTRLAQNQAEWLAESQVRSHVFIGEDGGGSHAGGGFGSERVVKGAPYCADAIHETVQWLPDGAGGAPNRIVRQTGTRLCRDGEGRTRQEVERNGRKLVYLRDPVSRENWVLDSERKTARRGSGGLPGDIDALADSSAWRDYAERMKEFARETAERARETAERARETARQAAAGERSRSGATPPVQPVAPIPPAPPTPPMPVVISRGDGAPHDVEVNVVRLRGSGAEAPAEWSVPPPAVLWRAQSLAPRGAGSVSPLPARDIEGLRANGERTIWTIEAGKLGNDKPIVITREVWTAPELMVTVQSRDFDPRSGEVNYRLKNIRRGEPDAALMRVPADYAKPPVRSSAPRASSVQG